MNDIPRLLILGEKAEWPPFSPKESFFIKIMIIKNY